MNEVFEMERERVCKHTVCLTETTLADNVTWTIDMLECTCVGME